VKSEQRNVKRFGVGALTVNENVELWHEQPETNYRDEC